MAAATLSALLEGPAQKGYLAVAEARASLGQGSRPTPVRGFTTLSHSLGQLAVCTHAGLLHAVAHEQSGAVLLVVMRTLCCLVPAAPYERLPADLLSNVVQVGGGHAFSPRYVWCCSWLTACERFQLLCVSRGVKYCFQT